MTTSEAEVASGARNLNENLRRIRAGQVDHMVAMFRSNEELLKKDDDHKPAKVPSVRLPWSAATGSPRSKILKRLALAFALCVFVYLFISNLPTDVPIRDRRRPVYYPGPDADKPRAPGPMPNLKPDRKPQWQSPRAPGSPTPDSATPPAPYGGPVIFQKLLQSLEAIYDTNGNSPVNKNVLFAAASLKSASLLLPMACKMGDELRNYVHFALIGGSGIDMDELRAVNGIDKSCQVIFHGMAPLTIVPCLGGSFQTDLSRRPTGLCNDISY